MLKKIAKNKVVKGSKEILKEVDKKLPLKFPAKGRGSKNKKPANKNILENKNTKTIVKNKKTKQQTKVTKNSKKIKNLIDWSKINPTQNSNLKINRNVDQSNFLPPNNSPNLLQKLKEQKKLTTESNENFISYPNLQDCPLNYAKRRIEKYIANRRSKSSYNIHHQPLIKKIRNESLVRNNDDQNKTRH